MNNAYTNNSNYNNVNNNQNNMNNTSRINGYNQNNGNKNYQTQNNIQNNGNSNYQTQNNIQNYYKQANNNQAQVNYSRPINNNTNNIQNEQLTRMRAQNNINTQNNYRSIPVTKPEDAINPLYLQPDKNYKIEYKGFSVLKTYGEDLTAKKYVTNPAIAREDEIKKTMIVLLTPDKSALLVGHAGIGKTAVVEGLAYLIQRDLIPNALKGYRIYKVNSTSLLGKINTGNKEEMAVTLLVDELKTMEKTILFIDEVHTLIGGSSDGPMDLANILKPALDRGDIKAIGATTTQEFNIYVIRDRAFLRRFDKIEIAEPNVDTTVKILMGSLPRIEKQTGVKFRYNNYITEKLVRAIVEATSEYKRVYGLAAMYPDIAFSVLSQAFSNALFRNSPDVNILDVYNSIKNSKRIYPDSIVKELKDFREKYNDICIQDNIVLPEVKIEDVQDVYDSF